MQIQKDGFYSFKLCFINSQSSSPLSKLAELQDKVAVGFPMGDTYSAQGCLSPFSLGKGGPQGKSFLFLW